MPCVCTLHHHKLSPTPPRVASGSCEMPAQQDWLQGQSEQCVPAYSRGGVEVQKIICSGALRDARLPMGQRMGQMWGTAVLWVMVQSREHNRAVWGRGRCTEGQVGEGQPWAQPTLRSRTTVSRDQAGAYCTVAVPNSCTSESTELLGWMS